MLIFYFKFFQQSFSTSVNEISTLHDFQYCTNLKELYIRNNKIADLDEIYYLKNLRNLKILWLADNKCSRDPCESQYRLTVIRNLPHLQKLDNSSKLLYNRPIPSE